MKPIYEKDGITMRFMPEEPTADDELIHDAAVLAGMANAGDKLSVNFSKKIRILLREMRAETECARLAKRVARYYGRSDPPSE